MGIIEILAIILFLMWIGGFALNIAGGFIHILLVAAIVVLIYRLVTGRRVTE